MPASSSPYRARNQRVLARANVFAHVLANGTPREWSSSSSAGWSKTRVGDGSIPSGEWRLGPSRTPVGRRVCCLLGRADSGAGDVKLSVTEARVLQVNPSHFERLALCLVDRHRKRQSDGELDAFNL